jgi:uncharacterized repeat protein (TIGR03803 family)
MRSKRLSIAFHLVLAVSAVSALLPGTLVAAQTETVLYSFNSKNAGAYAPWLSLTFDAAGNLYGTAQFGGSAHSGEVFELTPKAGGGWTTKFIFDFKNGTEGLIPTSGLAVDAAGNLYGTTYAGGPGNWGTAYELSPAGDGSWTEKVLHYFGRGTDGQYPLAGMVFDSAGNLYGTTAAGGTNLTGTVFELTPQSGGAWTEKVLYHFGPGSSTDGQGPQASLIFDSTGNLYGTTVHGGANSGGTAFKLSPQSGGGWAETVLYSFSYYSEPASSLIFDSAGNLYGTTGEGGATGFGSAFELSPQTGGTWTEKILHSFSNGKDGFNVFAGLTFDKSGNLYGSTMSGGAYGGLNGYGTVFKLTPEAGGNWSKSTLFSFDGTDGSGPAGGALIFDASGNLYGGGFSGGAYRSGVVFEITP